MPSAFDAASKVPRYGAQKSAGHPAAPADMEYRKRVAVSKATPSGADGMDIAFLPDETMLRLEGIAALPADVSFFRPSGRRDTACQARAPPSGFA